MGWKRMNCRHQKEDYSIYLCSPLQSGVRDFNKIVNYFQYEAPEIDSVHSVGKIVNEDDKKAILNRLLSIAKMQNNSRFLQKIQTNSLSLMGLDGKNLCIKCPRMICKIYKDESDLAALLRHLRNSFAHGRSYVKRTKNQTYIVLEDYKDSKQQHLTAKIVITKAIMEKWKEELESWF